MDIKLLSDICGVKDKMNNYNNRIIGNLIGIGECIILLFDIMK